MSERLKLRAEDDDDLTVLSSMLQDALVAVGDLAYLPEERRFVLVANRFIWEQCLDVTLPPDRAVRDLYYRVHCGLTFETVTAVRTRGFDRADRGRLLELLALQRDKDAIELLFAGEVGIQLSVERLFVHASDVDEPWPTRWRPRHPVLDAP